MSVNTLDPQEAIRAVSLPAHHNLRRNRRGSSVQKINQPVISVVPPAVMDWKEESCWESGSVLKLYTRSRGPTQSACHRAPRSPGILLPKCTLSFLPTSLHYHCSHSNTSHLSLDNALALLVPVSPPLGAPSPLESTFQTTVSGMIFLNTNPTPSSHV